ncbi:MAG: ferrous iron transport protein B [Gemmiger sp.]|uniref:ferrous iron transport protein B n=1 Tax=Gemmiger sp. TaxID=2049027 RepID=UPI002A80A5E3|nr:ferrous iron transport protein B [Gemmiger sp.]MCI6141598.1 ferrous iron transport protein B [Subdoligranulum variabile]MDD6610476.1 ferrous iron transport protein B [Subdoligranulum variabile]MDD6650198.1 ferrous iron transport protein B [Subdoligranulum variabile]MDY4448578.1 ferrous iron transport protein B [Gemmiger sp.]MDY5411529.1 ferrous iron transport protein B [Gemmiger sp.]
MTLAEIKVGQDAVLRTIGGQGELRHHLLDMGLTPGTEVTLRKVAPMGDPIEVELRGYELTLRLADAAKIEVDNVHETDRAARSEARHAAVPHPGVGELRKAASYHDRKAGSEIAKGQPLHFALAGNQNCGKTTLFNQLTGSNQHVGNFPGVTVDRKDGIIRGHAEATVTDLPGIYSLSPYSSEEIVTRDFLLNTHPDGIINIVDATNIDRNLYLTMQLMELGIPMVLALNMMDEVRANGGTIMVNKLEELLGVPVVPISAAKNEGIDELVEHALHVARHRETPGRIDFCDAADGKDGAVHRCIHAVTHLIEDHAQRAGLPLRFSATKLVEGDRLIEQALQLDENETELLGHTIAELENETGLDREAALADMRFTFIERLCDKTVVRPGESREHKRSVAIDKVLTGKYTALPCFIGIMALVFWLTFGVIGAALSDLLTLGIDAVTNVADHALTVYGINPVVHSLVIDGIFAGVGSVLSFLPVIVTLFFFLSILEDTGYMARVAFVMDQLLRRVGLSGRSFVPMLIGFGCSVPAIMATRTLSSDRDRKMTILLTPFMSCSAKLPIYALFTTAFFPRQWRAVVMVGLYITGIVCGILYALVLKLTRYKGEPVPFVMELPNYRFPSARSVGQLIWEKAKDFLQKAFTIIFVATVLIWFLQTFDTRLNVATPDSSLLALIGSWVAPLFKPLGFGDWRVSTALITGFTAKESVVSTLTVLLGGDTAALATMFTPFTAIVFLVFTLLYTPCVAAIAAVKRELGGAKAAAGVVIMQCAIAWVVAFVVHCVGTLLGFV